MRIAIVGATGEVGRMMLKTLDEMGVSITDTVLFASERSAGKTVSHRGQSLLVYKLTPQAMKNRYDGVLFSAGGTIAREFAPIAAESGNLVIDNSSAFRRDEDIPLVVPEINGHLLKGYRGIVANPNCSTIQMVLALAPLHRRFGLKKVIASTYQSVSGAGHQGIQTLERQENGVLDTGKFPRNIHRNVIPQIGAMLPSGYCEEEEKMHHETRKILDLPEIEISCETVRVPVIYGHAISVHAEFEQEIDLLEAENLLDSAPSVCYRREYLTPAEIGESTLSHVGKLRLGAHSHALRFWNVGHNVRLGAATNAVRILLNSAEC